MKYLRDAEESLLMLMFISVIGEQSKTVECLRLRFSWTQCVPDHTATYARFVAAVNIPLHCKLVTARRKHFMVTRLCTVYICIMRLGARPRRPHCIPRTPPHHVPGGGGVTGHWSGRSHTLNGHRRGRRRRPIFSTLALLNLWAPPSPNWFGKATLYLVICHLISHLSGCAARPWRQHEHYTQTDKCIHHW